MNIKIIFLTFLACAAVLYRWLLGNAEDKGYGSSLKDILASQNINDVLIIFVICSVMHVVLTYIMKIYDKWKEKTEKQKNN